MITNLPEEKSKGQREAGLFILNVRWAVGISKEKGLMSYTDWER